MRWGAASPMETSKKTFCEAKTRERAREGRGGAGRVQAGPFVAREAAAAGSHCISLLLQAPCCSPRHSRTPHPLPPPATAAPPFTHTKCSNLITHTHTHHPSHSSIIIIIITHTSHHHTARVRVCVCDGCGCDPAFCLFIPKTETRFLLLHFAEPAELLG